MIFWLAGTALSAAVTTLLVMALIRHRDTPHEDAQREVEFYKSQLASVEDDLQQNRLSAVDAEQARREVSRRLLRAHERTTASCSSVGTASRLSTSLACILVILVFLPGSAALYWLIGNPNLPDLSLSERLRAAELAYATRPSQREIVAGRDLNSITTEADPELVRLVGELRTSLAAAEPDLEGLRMLVRSELSIGNFAAAIQAQRDILALLDGEARATDFSQMTDLLVIEAGGYVSPEAEAAIYQALARDPENPAARYYLGLMYAQTGRPDLTVNIWNRLIEDLPPTSPIAADLRLRLPAAAQAAGITNINLPPEPLPRPSSEDIAAAESMSVEDRAEFITGMVESLRNRLDEDGGSAIEWTMLINSQMTIGQYNAARMSYERALEVFADSPDDLQFIMESTDLDPAQ
ncbi:MAG: c-type cytochrome biogenesis protein CcmI [Rhodobacteraceae bacterium]|nr:c-type cytochrome biogenesis protein CcmI [Paracoccaceae bacterium]